MCVATGEILYASSDHRDLSKVEMEAICADRNVALVAAWPCHYLYYDCTLHSFIECSPTTKLAFNGTGCVPKSQCDPAIKVSVISITTSAVTTTTPLPTTTSTTPAPTSTADPAQSIDTARLNGPGPMVAINCAVLGPFPPKPPPANCYSRIVPDHCDYWAVGCSAVYR